MSLYSGVELFSGYFKVNFLKCEIKIIKFKEENNN